MSASVTEFDLIIVGAGLAGGALAVALADLPLKVALIEGQAVREGWPPLEESVFDYDGRVSALTEGSREFLDQLGVWSEICDRRVCAYTDMEVWDGEGTVVFILQPAKLSEQRWGILLKIACSMPR